MNWEWILLEMKINKLETKLYENEKKMRNKIPFLSSQQGLYHQVKKR